MIRCDEAFSIGRRRLGFAIAGCCLWPGISLAGAFDDYFKAVRSDDARTVASLLRRGFDPNAIEPERGENGLILALREEAMQVFQVLLDAEGVDPGLSARNGDDALMIAAYKGNLPAVGVLLDKGVEVNRPGWTALHYASAIGHNAIVKRLLDHAAYIDAESPNRTTPLMMAARGGHILTVKLLLDEGADATLKNNLGMTAIEFARNNGHTDIAEGLTARLRKAGNF